MPNGDPDWRKKELPKLKVFFKRIAPVLKKFAKDHNLKINKYYHQGSDWTFRFRHPQGGMGNITVAKCDEPYVNLYPHWWVDYYDTSRRDFKHGPGVKSLLDSETLYKHLNEMLQLVLSWQKEDLTKGTENPYREHIERSREEFEKQYKKYTTPKFEK